MFQLTKWYLDLVTDQGTVLVGYVARLRWGALRLPYASILRSGPEGDPVEQSTFRQVEDPALEGDCLTWRNGPLAIAGRWQRESPPLLERLTQHASGGIDWHCHFPRARATLSVAGREFSGWGYAECLRLTLPPAELPFRTLHWGRHLSDRHAVVWIEWNTGPEAHRWIWLDGQPAPEARFDGDRLTRLRPGLDLQIREGRTLCDRRPLHDLMEPLPTLARHLLGPSAGLREHKWLCRSALRLNGEPLDEGWTIHEEVTW